MMRVGIVFVCRVFMLRNGREILTGVRLQTVFARKEAKEKGNIDEGAGFKLTTPFFSTESPFRSYD